MSEISKALDQATQVRPAISGRPQDGPYPATVEEVADEVVEWVRAMNGSCAPGLSAQVINKLVGDDGT